MKGSGSECTMPGVPGVRKHQHGDFTPVRTQLFWYDGHLGWLIAALP